MVLVVDMLPTIMLTMSAMVPAITEAGIFTQQRILVAGKPQS